MTLLTVKLLLIYALLITIIHPVSDYSPSLILHQCMQLCLSCRKLSTETSQRNILLTWQQRLTRTMPTSFYLGLPIIQL